MSVINSIPLISAGDDGYQISRSVRLRNSASGYFNRTFAAAGNRQKMTFSMWVKRGQLAYRALHSAGWSGSGASQGGAWINFASDSIEVAQQTNNAYDWQVRTTAVYRDPSAWYHIVIAIDTTQATAANRVIVYVNGVQVTSYSTASYPTLNLSTKFNATNQRLFALDDAGNPYVPFDGYATETFFIDGQALTPSSFGETDAITGVWKPKKYAGTYGTNGFYLNFSDNSNNTAATIGKDSSGNGNNWTPNNISVTAGSTYDSMLDVPTPYADGGNGRGNYATWNPTIAASTGVGTITNGNLQCVTPTSGASNNYGTIGVSSGKWYWEITPTSISTNNTIVMIGVNNNTQSATEFYSQSGGYAYRGNGEKWNNGSSSSYGSALSVNDVIGVAFDADARTLEFYRNGTSMGTAYTSIPAGEFFPAICDTGTTVTWTAVANFGQRPFTYTPPTGFKALNTQNLPDATIKKGSSYFNPVLWTGTGGARTITGVGFQPDLVWAKSRSAAVNHFLQDSARGANKVLASSTTNPEYNSTTDFSDGGLGTSTSDGFTVVAGTSNANNLNQSSATYVAWNWKESVTAGFDIVTYTGTGSNTTIAHSLGVAPKMMIVKTRSVGTYDWCVYHANLTSASYYIPLNGTAAQTLSTNVWNATAPTSSVFSIGTSVATNTSGGTHIAYLFAEVAGFSRFGSYTGNGSTDGPFVFCGFRPRWLMVKRTDTTSNWELFDTARDTYNVAVNYLYPNLSNAESPGTGPFDFVSNGFKLRFTHANHNASGGTYIFAAFAENPFKNSLAR